jgi:HEPN domain-containing protein
MKRATRPWIRKAEDDFVVARKIAAANEALHDAVCFHCQQSAEKYLKALLEELSLTVPRTHNLDDLLTLLHSQYPTLYSMRRGLIFLTDFAVNARYPGDLATKRQAASALRWATRIRDACRDLLGLPRRHKTSR